MIEAFAFAPFMLLLVVITGVAWEAFAKADRRNDPHAGTYLGASLLLSFLCVWVLMVISIAWKLT